MSEDPSKSGGDPAGTPQSPDGSGRRGRGRWWTVIGIVVVALVAGAVVAVVRGGLGGTPDTHASKSGASACDESKRKTGVTKPEKAPKDGEVKVTEADGQIVTSKKEKLNNAWAFGTTVKNTSDLVAKDVTLTFTAKTPDGKLAGGDGLSRWSFSRKVPFVLPGKTFGTGVPGDDSLDAALIDDPHDRPAADSLKLNVKVKVGEWWKIRNDVYEFAPVAAKSQSVTSKEDVEQFMAFSAHSDFCRKVPAAVGVIFRDSKGNIVGGDYTKYDILSTLDPESSDDKLDDYMPGKTMKAYMEYGWYRAYLEDDPNGVSVVPDRSKTEFYACPSKTVKKK